MGETSERDGVRHLNCPCCDEPVVPGRFIPKGSADCDHPAGWVWFDDQVEKCKKCGCLVGVEVTDDYAEDRVAQAYMIEECS